MSSNTKTPGQAAYERFGHGFADHPPWMRMRLHDGHHELWEAIAQAAIDASPLAKEAMADERDWVATVGKLTAECDQLKGAVIVARDECSKSACWKRGAEPGCNIDCVLCELFARVDP